MFFLSKHSDVYTLCGLTLLTQKSRAFSHGAPTPICSASTAILTRPTVSLAANVIRASIMARWAFWTNHKRVSLTVCLLIHSYRNLKLS